MPKQQQAPWSYKCKYKDSCPHLERLSTHWVWGEYQRSSDENLEHWRIRDIQRDELEKALEQIKILEKENDELKAKYQALHKRQFKANKSKHSNKSSKDSEDICSEKKRGAPVGHKGWYRPKPDHIDETIYVEAPEICPYCSCSDLAPVDEIKDHLQEDIVIQPRTHVTNFKHDQAFCPKCNRPVIKKAEGELLNCHIGPATRAVAVFLRYELHIPYRKVRELFDVLFNLPFVPASAMAFDRKATTKGEPLYEDIREKLRCSATAHGDETFWRENGIGHYLWYGGNNDIAFFHIDRYRTKEVAQYIFGNNFGGILIADAYASYNAINPKDRQSCLAHLIRKAKEIKQEILLRDIKFQEKRSLLFCDSIVALFKKACEIGQQINAGDIEWDRAEQIKKRFYSFLNSICTGKLNIDTAESFRRRLLDPKKEYHRIFTFLKYQNVQTTNNQAEQSLRGMVIFRKICFGTRSAEGSYSQSVLPSLLLTAKRQGKHPLDFLKTLFTSDIDAAHSALYNNSS